MWPNADETQELLDRAAGGDAGAVNALLERHRTALRRMIDLRLDPALGRRVDASDIVQDVLVDAHRRLSDYLAERRMPFHLWLRHIAKDRLIDAHRVYHSGSQLDQYVSRGLLRPGKNTILLKVCQNEQTQSWARPWDFQLRVCDPTGAGVLSADRRE